jgi:hypothetical protein
MARTTFSGPVASENGFLNLSTTEFGVTITAPAALAASYTLTLPPDDGTVGQGMITDGAGTLTWATIPGSGTVTSVATAGTVNGLTLTGGTITTSGTITLGGTLVLSSPPAIGAVAPAAGAFTSLTGTLTAVSATPGTSRAIYGKYTTFTSMTSGNLVGTRGEVTMGGNVTGTAFLYGAQGKIITGANTIDVGSSYVAGVYGQLDLTGATVTSGYVCGVASDIFGVTGTVAADLFYGQHANSGTINAFLRAYGKATSVFEFDVNGGTQASTAAVSSATGAGYLRIKVDGAVRYINLYSGAPA